MRLLFPFVLLAGLAGCASLKDTAGFLSFHREPQTKSVQGNDQTTQQLGVITEEAKEITKAKELVTGGSVVKTNEIKPWVVGITVIVSLLILTKAMETIFRIRRK